MPKLDQVSTRVAFGDTLFELAKEDKDILVISADTARSMGLKKFETDLPDQIVNVGIAEQNMMMVAAGAAAAGQKAVATTYAPFTCMRALEQLRTFIAYPKLDVKIIGGMSGLTGSIEGVTHQGQEDVPIMRAIPNVVVIVPADAASTRVIIREIMKHHGPVYVGLGRSESQTVFDETYQFDIGKGNLVKPGQDVTIICNGPMVARAIEAVTQLAAEGIDARLIEMPCVKPIDQEIVLKAAMETGRIVTAEDRTIVGGLGSAVCEVLSEHYPVKVKRIGVLDTFAESGPQEELYDRYHLGVIDIVEAVRVLMDDETALAGHPVSAANSLV